MEYNHATDSFPDGDEFLWPDCFRYLYRFGCPFADDRFLFGRVDLPLRCLLSVGTDALVLEVIAFPDSGYVKLNSMGASMAEIHTEYVTLWVQCAVYFVLACWVYRYNIRKTKL